MNLGANVRSLDALADFKASLTRFKFDTEATLGQIDHELQHTQGWLEERLNHWRSEHRRRQEDLQRTQADLNRCLASGYRDRDGNYHPPDCRSQESKSREAKSRVAEAEGQLQTVMHWSQMVQQASDAYRAQARRLAGQLSTELPKAAASLENQINSLRAYLSMSAPSGGGGLSVPAGSTYPPDPSTWKFETLDTSLEDQHLYQQLAEAQRYVDLAREAQTAGGAQGAAALEALPAFQAVKGVCEALASFVGFGNYWTRDG